jgi:hypothetical protein
MPEKTESIRETLERFVEGFNVNDLDQVMTFFAEEALYRVGDKEHRGKPAIRKAFEPQFRGVYGNRLTQPVYMQQPTGLETSHGPSERPVEDMDSPSTVVASFVQP